MKFLLVIGVLFWIGAISSSVTDETANKILDGLTDSVSRVADKYHSLQEDSLKRTQSYTKSVEVPQQLANSILDQPSQNGKMPNLITQSSCVIRTHLLSQLENNYQEYPLFSGRDTQGRLIEILRSSNGTFSIISTDDVGNACLLASGSYE